MSGYNKWIKHLVLELKCGTVPHLRQQVVLGRKISYISSSSSSLSSSFFSNSSFKSLLILSSESSTSFESEKQREVDIMNLSLVFISISTLLEQFFSSLQYLQSSPLLHLQQTHFSLYPVFDSFIRKIIE